MEDQEILTLFQQRNQGAIPALEEQYGRRLRALAGRLLGNPQDAEECVSDAYLAAWNPIPPEEPRRLFLRRYWHAQTIREIAQVYSVFESKVKMPLLRTRKKLWEFLEKEELW